ncbi:hypothetical protein CD798_10115 [Bacillaceae bacterium SAOS 7]|nr:hypothetical protein CD798_10115 [Bacillaceae bacterium SAOS 7]
MLFVHFLHSLFYKPPAPLLSILLYGKVTKRFQIYPALTGSKTPTSKFSESKEVRWGSTARKSPIGSTNNQ